MVVVEISLPLVAQWGDVVDIDAIEVICDLEVWRSEYQQHDVENA